MKSRTFISHDILVVVTAEQRRMKGDGQLANSKAREIDQADKVHCDWLMQGRSVERLQRATLASWRGAGSY